MATEKRLIDANILEERVNQEPTDGMYTHEIVAVIKEQPTVDAVEVVHGRWDTLCNGKMLMCSSCKTGFDNTCNCINEEWHYCPNCGAKMDGGNENV